MKIIDVSTKEILDSKGVPTLSTKIVLDDNSCGIGEVPSGASTGKTEVLELRDNDLKRHRGKGVLNAVSNIESLIRGQIVGQEFLSQESFDQFLIDLDGTELKSNFGGNTILSLSIAFAKATAVSKKLPLYEYFGKLYWREGYKKEKLNMPEPLILMMEGGSHANWVTDIQEFMIVPRMEKFENFSEALRAGCEIFHTMEDILKEKKYTPNTGVEGAYAPREIKSNREALDLVIESIEKAGYKKGEEIYLAVDVAASEFFDTSSGKYVLKSENKSFTNQEWIDFQKKLFKNYPVQIIEDPLDQEDWEGWSKFMKSFGNDAEVVGDDLLTTNTSRIEKARKLNAVNSVLIKPNQIGTVTETMRALRLSEEMEYSSIISHRSGETNDAMISDLAVGTYANKCKFGPTNRGERIAKYNRLLEIEEGIL